MGHEGEGRRRRRRRRRRGRGGPQILPSQILRRLGAISSHLRPPLTSGPEQRQLNFASATRHAANYALLG